MKVEPVTKVGNDVMSANCVVIVIFQFMANLDQSRSQISDTWSVQLTFSLIVGFYLAKTENRTKEYLTQLSHYCFE